MNRHPLYKKGAAWLLDGSTFGMMNLIQLRHASRASTRDAWLAYVRSCEGQNRESYYAVPPVVDLRESQGTARPHRFEWTSAVESAHPANQTVRADLYLCDQGWKAPTVLMLHALMSASDLGYRGWAAHFNKRGWNAAFIHLPYHYSRKPPSTLTGELAITSNLVQTAEGLRQGVVDLRQLMGLLRERGCPGFGMWATSYGGWIGALLASVEADFRFIVLLEPIVNVSHAIWHSPAGRSLSAQIRKNGISEADVALHYLLVSPMHAKPLCPGPQIYLIAGEHDRIALPQDIQTMSQNWEGSHFRTFPQGHLGYTLMKETFDLLESRRVW